MSTAEIRRCLVLKWLQALTYIVIGSAIFFGSAKWVTVAAAKNAPSFTTQAKAPQHTH